MSKKDMDGELVTGRKRRFRYVKRLMNLHRREEGGGERDVREMREVANALHTSTLAICTLLHAAFVAGGILLVMPGSGWLSMPMILDGKIG